MLVKLGVGISRLEYHCRRVLSGIDKIYAQYGLGEAILTSTFEGSHSPGSLHYQNRAFDLRLPSRYPNSTVNEQEVFLAIKSFLGKDFDVILESTHIHVEYDPK